MPSKLENELYASALRYMNEHMPRSGTSQNPKKATHPNTGHGKRQPSTNFERFTSVQTPSPPALPSQLSNLSVQNPSTSYPPSFQESIDRALQNAWAPSTLKTYSTGINAYVNFCRLHRIPSNLVYPASEFLLCAFFASKQGLSPATLKNYIAGLRAWHTRDNETFPSSTRLKLIIKSSIPNTPSPPPKQAVSIQMLECLSLNLSESSFDTAVLACACTAFWGLCRLGELLPNSKAVLLVSSRQPLASQVSKLSGNTLKVFLPYTKIARNKGETIFLSEQYGPSNPISALQKQLQLRSGSPNTLLFSYEVRGLQQTLTKPEFMARCNTIWLDHGLPRSTGHSFRIGGTTHLLLCGIDPSIIKKAGRWASDSFLRYWRNLEVILPAGVRFASSSTRPHTVGEPQKSHGCGRAQVG